MQRAGQVKYLPNGQLNKVSGGVSSAAAAASNSVVGSGGAAEGLEILSSMLAAASPEQQKQILGERLYPLVNQHKVLIFFLLGKGIKVEYRICLTLQSL